MKKTAWEHNYKVASIDETAVETIVAHCGLSALTARILVARGIDTPNAVSRFLTPSLERDWYPSEEIPGLLDVADKVEQVIRAGGRILVFGDFDVDGITATTVSVRGLRALGADAVGLIPHRYEEGYALSEKAVQRGMQLHPDLVMTVDCGISCGLEVQAMRKEGIDVCITDHHEAGEFVPQGVPVADPKLSQSCRSRDLAGAGVALKLLCVLGARFGQPDLWRDFTDFAALGTVADLMPLVDENRALVADGIRRINNNPRICMSALAAICGVKTEEITSTRLSFSLIPRLNAAGRMGDATVALNLMLSDDRETAERLAAELDEVNQSRRDAESQLADQVEQVLEHTFEDESVIVVAGEGWHEGVKGIVASRIARKYKRPAVIFTIEDGVARGSGRSFGDINLFELAGTCSDLFEKFGGHAAAIGITLPASSLEEFKRRMCSTLDAMGPQLDMRTPCDMWVDLEECTVDNFKELDCLQPCGNNNQVPVLVAPNVFLENRSAVGKTGNHLRYFATDGASRVAGIFFGVDDMDSLLSCESACDVIFEPSVDEWQGRYTAKLMTKKVMIHESAHLETKISARVDELFARSAEICDKGEYAGITQADQFPTKVVGVTFENRQSVLATLEAGVELRLLRQPENEMDMNAIAVTLLDGTQLGYLNRHLALRLAPVMDAGTHYDAAVLEVTGGPAQNRETQDTRIPGPLGVRDPGVVDRSYGVNILVRRDDPNAEPLPDPQAQQLALRQSKQQWESVPAAELDDKLREALIGNHSLHDAQAQTLQHLAAGRSTLCVMATGRGKSLIFHLHAARTALRDGKASVFIYPLRALVADQAYHLQETFSGFGLQVCVLTGETDEAERQRIFSGLADGSVNVVLTTPEFITIHAQKFADTGRIGFVVVDEAHHVGLSRAGNRPAYADLDAALQTLGNPLVLAVTATAGDEEAKLICKVLGIEQTVLDPTVRENLHIDDKRDLRNRENYLASLVASGGKCVAYVNSRDQSMELTRMLRKRLPQLAARIAFYNAGLPKADRKRIENAFRDGELMAIVSTSAFGEGIDIPDIEHVVLYHLPFNDIEFNQMSGRAGRNGKDATVHLLYSYGDAHINEKILSSSAPARNQMVALYKVLMKEQKTALEEGNDSFSCTNSELAGKAARIDRQAKLDESAVSTGIAVFRELGFLETSGRSVARHIKMVQGPERMDLNCSVRYREGGEEIEDFAAFKAWALGASSADLLARFNQPILPNPELL